jgi:hypothetical protein
MRRFATLTTTLAVLALLCAPAGARAQMPERINDKQVKDVLARLDHAATDFRHSLDSALDKSSLDGSRREERINDFVKAFAKASERLHDKFDDDNQSPGLARDVLVSAQDIDRFMATHRLTGRANEDWSRVRAALDDLATAYSVSWTWDGSPEINRVGDKDVKGLLGRIEGSADRFRASLDAALDASEINGTGTEDEINGYVKDFEQATDKWKSHFGDHHTAEADAAEVLARAQAIDRFMAAHPLTERAQSDWADLRTTLDELARAYNVAWNW